MKKILLACSLIWAVSYTCFAQSEKEESAVVTETQQQIVDLKKSRKIIYVDSYEGKQIYERAKLRQKNQKKLEYMIRQFLVKDLGLSDIDAQELYDFVDDKLQNVERSINGATIAHMFSWIAKESLVSLFKKNKYNFDSIAEFIQHPELYELDDTLKEKIEKLKHNPEFVIHDEKIDTVYVPEASVDTVEMLDSLIREERNQRTTIDTVDSNVKQTLIVEPTTVQTQVPEPQPEQKTSVDRPAIVKELYKANNFQAITTLLTSKKNAGLVNWGNSKAMSGKLDKCFVVVVDRSSKEVITILGTGTTARINYSDCTRCSDEQFANHSRIYVQEL